MFKHLSIVLAGVFLSTSVLACIPGGETVIQNGQSVFLPSANATLPTGIGNITGFGDLPTSDPHILGDLWALTTDNITGYNITIVCRSNG